MVLTEKQQVFYDGLKECDFGIGLWKRKSGKTLLGYHIITELAYNNSNKLICVYINALNFVGRGGYGDYIRNNGYGNRLSTYSNKLFKFNNGSIVEFFSHNMVTKTYGRIIDCIYVDDFANANSEVIKEVLEYKKNIKSDTEVIFFSTLTGDNLDLVKQYFSFNKYFIHYG